MLMLNHELVIFLGLKSFSTLASMFLIVIGGWLTDRELDDKDVEETVDDYENLGEGEEAVPFYYQIGFSDIVERLTRGDPETKGFRAGVFARVTVLGWMLFFVSFFFSNYKWVAYNTMSPVIIASMVLCVLIPFFHVFVFPKAVDTYQVYGNRYALFGFLFVAYLLLGVLIQINNKNAPSWLAPTGGLSIALSYLVLWFERKRGYDLDKSRYMKDPALPQPHHRHLPASLFSFGAPLFVFGWCAFWMTLNATKAYPSDAYFPIYLNSGSRMAWVGAAILLATIWMIGYAVDETPSNDMDLARRNKDASALGILGRFFFSPLHASLLLMVGWGFLAIGALLPYVEGYWPWILAGLCALQGAAWVVFYRNAIAIFKDSETTGSVQSEQSKSLFRVCIVLLILWFVGILFAIERVSANLLSAFGITLFLGGMRGLQRDRRRGETFEGIETEGKPEDDSSSELGTVYSVGAILVPAGICCLAYAASVPRSTY